MTDVTNTMLPLNALEVEAQLGKWIATGLPSGTLTAPGVGHRVSLKVADPSLVHVWARALSERVGENDRYISVCAYPKALQGWRLRVWCDAPAVRAEQMIECSAVTA